MRDFASNPLDLLLQVSPREAFKDGRQDACTDVEWLHSVWDPPGSGIEPVCPVSAGGFLATEPPGKPRGIFSMEKSL